MEPFVASGQSWMETSTKFAAPAMTEEAEILQLRHFEGVEAYSRG